MGITELDFWQMTLAEVERAVASKVRVKRIEAQEKASFDYILAQLITRGCNIAFTGKGELPQFDTVYSSLLEDDNAKSENSIQAKKQKQQDELSALRFQLFAQSYNKRMGANENK